MKAKKPTLFYSLIAIILLAILALGITLYKNQVPQGANLTQDLEIGQTTEESATPEITNTKSTSPVPENTSPATESEIDAKLDLINRGVIDIDSSFNDNQTTDL